MRYRNITKINQMLGQVFTPPILSRRLIEAIADVAGEWLELGVGAGSIMQACLEYGNPTKYVGLEIDEQLIDLNKDVDEKVQIFEADVLNPLQVNRLLKNNNFSYVVGNPPYGEVRMSELALARMNELCPRVTHGDWGHLDLYFMLESMAHLKSPGVIAFIVASPIVSLSQLKPFREMLINRASEIECIELPINTFQKAEVQSYLIVAKLCQNPSVCKVLISRFVGEEFVLDKRISISNLQASERMDIAFYEFNDYNNALISRNNLTLKDIGAKIVRGSRSKSQFESMGIKSFHTTDFPGNQSEIAFSSDFDGSFQVAKAGDILVPRVGSRCLNKQVMVSKGSRPYTDSVFRLNVTDANRNKVFDWMSSPEGINWRLMAAHGSCAKHLTVPALLAMPIPA